MNTNAMQILYYDFDSLVLDASSTINVMLIASQLHAKDLNYLLIVYM